MNRFVYSIYCWVCRSTKRTPFAQRLLKSTIGTSKIYPYSEEELQAEVLKQLTVHLPEETTAYFLLTGAIQVHWKLSSQGVCTWGLTYSANNKRLCLEVHELQTGFNFSYRQATLRYIDFDLLEQHSPESSYKIKYQDALHAYIAKNYPYFKTIQLQPQVSGDVLEFNFPHLKGPSEFCRALNILSPEFKLN
jgi:hypothetical protein